MRSWHTLPDGSTEVDGTVPRMSLSEAERMKRTVLGPWGPDMVRESMRTGVPIPLLAATIETESKGNPGAIGDDSKVVPGATTTGLGLCQITFGGFKRDPLDPAWPNSRPLTDREVMVPATNIAIAANILRTILRTNPTPPEVASVYNAGGGAGGRAKRAPNKLALASPWGLAEHPGHLDRFVRAYNTAIALGWSLGATTGGAVLVLAACGLLAAWALSLPPTRRPPPCARFSPPRATSSTPFPAGGSPPAGGTSPRRCRSGSAPCPGSFCRASLSGAS
jgi:hypothetical protein